MVEQHEVLIELLRDVNRSVFEMVHQTAGSPGVGSARMLIMGRLAANPGSTISELARAVGLAKSHVSNTVDDLVRRGWLEKRHDTTDLRLVRIYPTKRSEEEFKRIKKAVRQKVNAALAALPKEQVDSMLAGLRALRAGLSRYLLPESAEAAGNHSDEAKRGE